MVSTMITTAKITTTIAAIVAPTITPVDSEDFELSSTDDGRTVGSGSCTLDDIVVITEQSSASNDSNVMGQLGSIFRISRFTVIDGADCTQFPIICTISLASITETGSCGVTLAL